jgi:restriction endonuclease Mrr
VSTQNLVDAAKRGGDGSMDFGLTPALLGAVARIDNTRRELSGERPRFRINGNRLWLEEWLLDPELLAAERDLLLHANKYRALAEKSLHKALAALPHRAVGEVVILLLEALGLKEIALVRRPGTHGAELHLRALVDGPGGEARVAVVVRRDGREVGRERVTELRGALHHYGPAQQGILVTTGQVLSGAREEARASGASPVMLIDGARLAALCFEHGLFVRSTSLRLKAPDFAMLETIKSG